VYDRDRDSPELPALASALPPPLALALQRLRRRLWLLGSLHALGLLLAAGGWLGIPLLLLFGARPLPHGLRLLVASLLVLGIGAAIGRELWLLFKLGRPAPLARLLERAVPGLTDRVTTSVALAVALPPGASAELAREHLVRSATLVDGTSALALTTRQLWRRTWPTLLVGLVGALVALGLGWRWGATLRQGLASLRTAPAVATPPEVLPPLVTDIALTYRYPAYLRREPRTVEGTTGDVFAPRGTEVTIAGLADRAIDSAALIIGDQRLALTVTPPRQLSGTLLVSDESRYRFALGSGLGEQVERDGHAIRIEVDAPPEVQLVEPAADQVLHERDSLPIAYQVKDDFGLQEVRLVIANVRGGEPTRRLLDQPLAGVASLGGTAQLDLAPLGLAPGDRIAVSVEALDDDTVAGPKIGTSATRVIKIFSATEHHEELLEQLRKLFGQLVTMLADELENPFVAVPADELAGRSQLQRQRASANSGRETVAALTTLIRAFADDELAPREIERALRNCISELAPRVEERNAMAAALQSYFEAANRYAPGYAERLRSGQGELIAVLERHLIYLDDLINREGMAAAQLVANELARTQERLAELLAAYAKAGDDATRAQILEEIDRLKAKQAELGERLAKLRRDLPDGYVNPEALAERDLGDLDQLRQLIAEGRIEEAMRMLDGMRSGLTAWRDQMERSLGQFGNEAYAALRKRVGELRSEIEDLEQSQRTLAEQSEQRYRSAVEAHRRKARESVKALAARLEREARQIRDLVDKIEPGVLESYEAQSHIESREHIDATARALQNADLEGARESAQHGLAALNSLNANLERHARRGRRDPSTRAYELGNEAASRTARLLGELDRMFPSPASLNDPQTQRALREQARAQRSLQRRAERASAEMKSISDEVPLFGPRHQELLRRAGDEMGMAGQQLDGRELAGAASDQREAAGKLGELRRALDQLGQGQGQGQGQGMPMPLPGGGGGEGLWGDSTRERVEIPKPQDSRAPAAFRRDILDAMKEPAPSGFRDAVRRYYEELVK